MSPRAAAEKAGWKYDHSEALGMDYAIRQTQTGPEIMTADRVKYSPAEISLLSQIGGIELSIHLAKKAFQGEIVEVL